MRTNLNELRQFTLNELQKKLTDNPQYSQRAFARDIGLPPTSLQEFLEGKRNLGLKNLNKLMDYFHLRVHCSWCDAPKKECHFLVAGPRQQYICDSCLLKCIDLAKEADFLEHKKGLD